MTPYYESGGITIYHGDCREILPNLEIVDLLLTDPPYGIGRDGMKPSTSSHGGRKAYAFDGWDNAQPDGEVFKLLFASSKHQIIWGGNYFTQHLPPSMGWLFWDKAQRICGSDGELAFTSFQKALRVFTMNRVELAKDGAVHPTQKPLQLMQWCITYAGDEDSRSILDPFMGSGTTLRAAKDFGRRAIGIEREEKYCEIAVKSLAQEVLFH
jgi:site-specific DNA-methyltransferase (adenine-specific)